MIWVVKQDGALQNTAQGNCQASAPCGAGGCSCLVDNNGDGGVLINEFTGYQCAYDGGACTWDFVSLLFLSVLFECLG